MKITAKTIGQCLRERALQSKDRTVLEMGGQSFSFQQIDRLSDCLALRMQKEYGIRRGTHAGLWSVNSPGWVCIFLALAKLGAVPVLINTCWRRDELRGILNYSDAEVLFYGEGCKDISYGDIAAAVRKETPGVRHFIPIPEDREGNPAEKAEEWAGEISGEDAKRLEALKGQVRAEDPACMIFTSGTTSLPKGVLLTHYNLVNNSLAMVQAMGWGEKDKMCIAVPLFHCFGVTAGILSCMQAGAAMYLLPYFRTAAVWDAVEEKGCTVLNGVPSMFLAMIRKPQYRDRRADGLRSGIIAGSPVAPEEFEEICGRFPGMHLQPAYGQTETSPCVAIADWNAPISQKEVSVGKPLGHIRVRICSPDTGEPFPAGEDGEIQVQGYNVMAGYYKLPQANAKAFTPDGWIRTGDLGRLDENGELYITGRLKEMIVRAGENISPQEIEQVIRQLNWVRAVKAVGIPAEVLQEEIAACIVPAEGQQVDAEELRRYLKPRLAGYKIPAHVLSFEKFPMNASGKIDLKRLKEMAAERIHRQGGGG